MKVERQRPEMKFVGEDFVVERRSTISEGEVDEATTVYAEEGRDG
jgi:hypothetical protein